jgi:hypothetical protein
MPYISKNEREKYLPLLLEIQKLPDIPDKGSLEFILFTIMLKYMSNKEQRYSILHDCTYAAQHVSDEFRRRFLDIRENYAREVNGDC